MAKAKSVHSTPRKTASKSKRASAESTRAADAELARLHRSLETQFASAHEWQRSPWMRI
jgi:hypothetical protein